jgi:hypothetical protein
MFRATIKKDAVYIDASAEHPKTVFNAAGGKLFRKNADDVDSGDTELAPAAVVEITEGMWFVSTTSAEVVVRDVNVSNVDQVVASGKIVAGGEAQIKGDLNHDGTKIGFFGAAPVAKKNVKPAAEVSAKEIYEALEAYGLLE